MVDFNLDSFFELRPESESKAFSKTQFFVLDFGLHYARIVGLPKGFMLHFIPRAKAMVCCLGEDCPICATNLKIISEHPKDYRNVPGFLGRTYRYYMNAVDTTPVKVCDNVECQTENKKQLTGQFPTSCAKCGKFINDIPVTISNKVKVLSLSETNVRDIKLRATGVLDEQGSVIPLTLYDIEISVTKKDNKKYTSVALAPHRKDTIEVPDEFLYDLDKAVLTFSSEELNDLIKGISIKDIFSARRSKDVVTEGLTTEAAEITAEIQDAVKQLFN